MSSHGGKDVDHGFWAAAWCGLVGGYQRFGGQRSINFVDICPFLKPNMTVLLDLRFALLL
jgi:hypothetical protein